MTELPRRAVLEPMETELLDGLAGFVGPAAAEDLWARVCLLRGFDRPVLRDEALDVGAGDVAAVLVWRATDDVARMVEETTPT